MAYREVYPRSMELKSKDLRRLQLFGKCGSMRELRPTLRGVVYSEVLKEHLLSYKKEQLKKIMSDRGRMLLDSNLSRRGNQESSGMGNNSENEHRSSSRNSSDDPLVSSTHSHRHVSSNSRIHPRASNHVSHDSKNRSHDKSSRSHDSKSHSRDHKTPKRKRSVDDDGSIWTEHVSSSGRVYYYNKKDDKSQWEKPKEMIKRPKKELISPPTKSSSRQPSYSVKSSHSSTTYMHSRSLNNVGHKESLSKFRHQHQSSHRGDTREKEQSSHSSAHRNNHSRSASPESGKYRDKTPVKYKHKDKIVASPVTPMSKPFLVSPTTPARYSQTPPQSIDLATRNGDLVNMSDRLEMQMSTPYASGQKMDYAPHLVLNGPCTPDVPVHKLMCSPQHSVVDTSGLHPLQKALLLQNQCSQQQSYDPVLCNTPQSALPAHLSQPSSHPTSPRVQSPLTRTPPIFALSVGQPVTPMQGTMFTMPGNVHTGTYNPGMAMPAMVSSLQAASLHTPMSRLGYASMDGYNFLDLTSINTSVQQSPMRNLDMVEKNLTESWVKHNDFLQSQIDGCVRNTLEVAVGNTMCLSMRESASQLRLEGVQMSTRTANIRLTALHSLMEEINNR